MKGDICDLGRMAFTDALGIQKGLVAGVKEGRISDVLAFVEHDPVLTLGAAFHSENLLLNSDEYRERGIEVHQTDRGGDVTFHGPRQLVIYPIFDVSRHGKDLHKWLRDLEETMIQVLAECGLDGYRFPPHTGVWVQGQKVAAIGVKISRWVSMHGIALNCDNDLSPFNLIIPCGIEGYGVTSLSEQTGRQITTEAAKPLVCRAFERVFGLTFEERMLAELMDEAGKTTPSQALS